MFGKNRFSRWLVVAVVLAVAECASIAAIDIALTQPAQAQRADDRYPFLSRQRQQHGGFFGFGGLFGGGGSNTRSYPGESPPQQPSESLHAPAPRKPDPNAPAPTTSIMVMGDGMADWLAYGLEDAFSNSPEIGIVRKNKINSGLLRYEAKGDLDWWHVARDLLAQEKPNYVVMMLGISDRQNIRERDLAKEADKTAKEEQDKKNADQNAQTKQQTDDQDQPGIVAPEPQLGKSANGIIEFRSDKWAEVYAKRIDETIAALKSKGVPVFWVGLPSIRGHQIHRRRSYLNDLYRARAERAGVNYIDVWDGFVDEQGKYSNYGPDYEGQMRRLRSSDGVYFTKSGARKLAHYVEREIRRYMSNRVPVAFPSGPVGPVPAETKSKVRPVAGPVVPLTVTPGNSEELLGGWRQSAGACRCHRQPRLGQRRAGAGSARTRRRFRLAAGQRREPSAGRPARRACLRPPAPAPNAVARTEPSRGGEAARCAKTRAAAEDFAEHGRQARTSSIGWKPSRRPPRRYSAVQQNARLVPLATAQRGSVVDPIRNLSTACAAWRPSRIAHTTSDCPRRMSPAANTFGTDVE